MYQLCAGSTDDHGHGAADSSMPTNVVTSPGSIALLPLTSAQAQAGPPAMAQATNCWISFPLWVPFPSRSPGQVQVGSVTDQKPPVSSKVPPVMPPEVGPASCWPMVPPRE